MSSPASTERRLKDLSSAGYRTQAVFVDIPVEKSVERALSRHRSGLEAWRAGKPGELGGRYVAPDMIRSQEIRPGLTANRQAFEELKPQFDGWQLWDNSGTRPVLADRSAPPQPPPIAGVEDLRRLASQPYTGSTEAQARAAELGSNTRGGKP